MIDHRHMPRSGFTLIELSIVLVIIGLIIGGVLVGRDLIRQSELRADIGEIDKITSAVNTFKLKYGCLPGDCANATALFPAPSQPQAVTNGNGDGIIQGANGISDTINTFYYNPTLALAEWYAAFDQLAVAGLYNLPQYNENDIENQQGGKAYPAMHSQYGTIDPNDIGIEPSVPGGITIGYESDAHYIRYGACYQANGHYVPTFLCGFTSHAAFNLDKKIDDGLAWTGTVQNTNPIYILRVTYSQANSDQYCSSNTTNYLVQDQYHACALRVRAAF